MNNKLIFLTILALSFGACNDDDENGAVLTKRKKMTVNTTVNTITKAAGSTTENIQDMGFFVTPSDASQTAYIYKNTMLLKEYSSKEWIPTNPTDNSTFTLYWCPTANATTDIIAYAPYLEAATAESAFPFSVQADQSTLDNSKASDLLYYARTGLKPGDNNYKVTVNFEHLCAKFVVPLSKVAELEGLNVEAVHLGGVLTSADFSLQDGSLALKGVPGEIRMAYDATSKTAECIILPQAVEAGALYVTVTLSDGRDYECVLADPYTFAKGNQYSYDVTVGEGLAYTQSIRALGWNSVTEDLYIDED